MKRTAVLLPLAIAVIAMGACYHATIDTGRAPNGVTVSKLWANSFIYGLVPPAVVETASRCPNGIARVETQLSFLNQLVGIITLGIYTPMEVQVACAGNAALSPSEPVVQVDPSQKDGGVKAIEKAMELSKTSQTVVLVQF